MEVLAAFCPVSQVDISFVCLNFVQVPFILFLTYDANGRLLSSRRDCRTRPEFLRGDVLPTILPFCEPTQARITAYVLQTL